MASFILTFIHDLIRKSPKMNASVVAGIMKEDIVQVSTHSVNSPVILHPNAERLIGSAMTNRAGGLHVLTAPNGVGKTTYVRMLANSHIKAGGSAKLFSAEMENKNDFYRKFGIHISRDKIFKMMPNMSVIIFDQVEIQGTLNKEIRELMLFAALEARLTGNVNIVVVTSSIEVSKQIIAMNGGEKIRQLGKAADLRWGVNMVGKFMRAATPLRNWTNADREELRFLALQAGAAGFLYGVMAYHSQGLPMGVEREALRLRAQLHEKRWTDFAEAGL